MNDEGRSRLYSRSITYAYRTISSTIPDETPAGCIVYEFKEMISSYITDAAAFRDRNDLINEYASYTYAHGWLDCGIFLGYFKSNTPSLYLPDDSYIPMEQQERLKEKTLRYERMLKHAIKSVEPAPESGSPYYKAAIYIIRKAHDVFTRIENQHLSGTTYIVSLGWLSYGYGWLDAGLRAGLFRILENPDLFTTETSRKL